MYIRICAAAGRIGAEADGYSAVRHVSLGKANQRQRGCRLTRRHSVQRQTSEAARSLTIDPIETEVLRRDAPDGRSITGVEADDRAPYVRGGTPVIHEERIRPATACQEIRRGTAIQHVGATVCSNRICAAATVNEPVGSADANIKVDAGYVYVLLLQNTQ